MEYWFCVYHGKLTMDDVWRMTVADRRWWIGQTIDFIKKQNEAQENASKGRSSNPDQRNPAQIEAAREMLKNYHRLSSEEDN